MAWTYLALAGLFEIGWAIGLKYTDGFSRLVPSVLTAISMVISVVLLGLALRSLPVGTGYAVLDRNRHRRDRDPGHLSVRRTRVGFAHGLHRSHHRRHSRPEDREPDAGAPRPMTPKRRITALSSATWLKAFVVAVCLVIVSLEAWRDWSERQDELSRPRA